MYKHGKEWMYLLNSPFKLPKIKWYFGKIAVGTPYFLPRKSVKLTKEEIKENWDKLQEKISKAEINADIVIKQEKLKNWELYYKNERRNARKFKPIKYFGFNWVYLGWKTKWDEFRHEWNPGFSLVLFGKQLAAHIIPYPEERGALESSYWEALLTYLYETDKNADKITRCKQMISKYNCTWRGNNISTNYYTIFLKDKYQKYLDPANNHFIKIKQNDEDV